MCPTIAGTITNDPWSLIGNDSGSYDPSNIGYAQFPQPQYPFGEHPVSAGECVRGWIVLDVLRSVAITKIRYSVQDASGTPIITYWKPSP